VPSLPDYDPNNKQLWTYPDIHASWTWPGYEGKDLEVVVFGAGRQAELFLNGKSLGKKPTSRDNKYTATWQVPYAAGELKAVSYSDGQVDCEWVLRTAGPPAKLRLSADHTTIQADGQDLSYVTVEVLDAQGVRVPQAENLIRFEVKGQGVLAGVGNGKPYGTESFQKPQRSAFKGRCLAVLKSTPKPGAITLTATSAGLASDSVTIRAE
jgi:beta-galactosidase